MVTWNYFQLFHNWLTWYLLLLYRINVLVIDITWKFLADPSCNFFQSKILWFRIVSVSAKSFGQFSVSVSVSEPKPKRWFQSYTTGRTSSFTACLCEVVVIIFSWLMTPPTADFVTFVTSDRVGTSPWTVVLHSGWVTTPMTWLGRPLLGANEV